MLNDPNPDFIISQTLIIFQIKMKELKEPVNILTPQSFPADIALRWSREIELTIFYRHTAPLERKHGEP